MVDQFSSEDRTYTKDFMGMINADNQVGVVQGLEVTSYSGMYVEISSGRALFENSIIESGDEKIEVSTADASDDRKDLVYLTSRGSLSISEGTPASIPNPPNIGDSKKIFLAQIEVSAGTVGISDDYIRDERHMIYGNKYKDIYIGANPDSGVCEVFDDNNEIVDEDDWEQEYSPQKQWGGY